MHNYAKISDIFLGSIGVSCYKVWQGLIGKEGGLSHIHCASYPACAKYGAHSLDSVQDILRLALDLCNVVASNYVRHVMTLQLVSWSLYFCEYYFRMSSNTYNSTTQWYEIWTIKRERGWTTFCQVKRESKKGQEKTLFGYCMYVTSLSVFHTEVTVSIGLKQVNRMIASIPLY